MVEHGTSCISDANEEITVSVGEEFVAWADLYWGLGKGFQMYMKSMDNAEACPYSYARSVFIQKINDLIKKRLGI
jgi:hypothetical protein